METGCVLRVGFSGWTLFRSSVPLQVSFNGHGYIIEQGVGSRLQVLLVENLLDGILQPCFDPKEDDGTSQLGLDIGQGISKRYYTVAVLLDRFMLSLAGGEE